jgi:hypothetical protein
MLLHQGAKLLVEYLDNLLTGSIFFGKNKFTIVLQWLQNHFKLVNQKFMKYILYVFHSDWGVKTDCDIRVIKQSHQEFFIASSQVEPMGLYFEVTLNFTHIIWFFRLEKERTIIDAN